MERRKRSLPRRRRYGGWLLFLALWWGLPALVTGQDTLQIIDAEYGLPLPFASVSWREKERGGQADSNGLFVVPADWSRPLRLTASYLGYADRTVPIQPGRTLLALSLIDAMLREITVTAPRRVNYLPYGKERIGEEDLRRVQSLTTADALADLSGVYVQKSQFGGGSPVVRGFEANRVLLVVDGVRLNNAIFRGGHLQNAITVDPLALAATDVLYGSAALAYGSDAIGGVIHFRTREARLLERFKGLASTPVRWSGRGAVRFSSAARAFVPSVGLEYRSADFASLTQLSFLRTGDLRAGSRRPDRFPAFGARPAYVAARAGRDTVLANPDPDRQIGTAYGQLDLLQKFRFRLPRGYELSTNFQLSTSTDVPRYDALTERRAGQFRWARWDYGPQTRLLAAATLDLPKDGSLTLSHQFIEEDRLRRRFGDTAEENSLVDVHVTQLALHLAAKFGPAFRLRYGLDLRRDRIDSQGFLRDVVTGQTDPTGLEPRYPGGGATLLGAGAYVEGSYVFPNRNWEVTGGLRLNQQRLRTVFTDNGPVAWPENYLTGVGNDNTALTGALGLKTSSLGENTEVRFLISQGFRAPNLDDFGKFRENNGFVTVPNPDLTPERSLNLEAGFSWAFPGMDRGFIQGAVYHTWLADAIVRRAGRLPDGRDFFANRGDTLRVQTNVNADRARVYGMDLKAVVRPGDFEISGEFHYLRGRRRQAAPDGRLLTLPQDHIPPPYGRLSLGWAGREGLRLSAVLRYQLAKPVDDYAVGAIIGSAAAGYALDRLGTPDNLELTPRLPDGSFAGSYGWTTVNLYAQWQPKPTSPVYRLKVENLLDRHYRPFASGVSAPGLDVGVGVEWAF